jgi:dihydrofolate reductase
MDRAGLIGTGDGLPWRLPADLRRFKRLTVGKPVIMGRRTFASLGRPLPGRLNIVLTRSLSYPAAGGQVAHSLAEALCLAEKHLAVSGEQEAMVIGGREVFAEVARHCDKLYLTVIDGRFPGSIYFPLEEFVAPEWRLVSQEACPADAHNPHKHWFYILERERRSEGSLPHATCSPQELLVKEDGGPT